MSENCHFDERSGEKSCALASNSEVLYSEDMQDGLVVRGDLKIVNPFK